MLLTKKSCGGQLACRLCQGQCPNSLYFPLWLQCGCHSFRDHIFLRVMVNLERVLSMCFSYLIRNEKYLSWELSHPIPQNPHKPNYSKQTFQTSHQPELGYMTIWSLSAGTCDQFKSQRSLRKCHFFNLWGWKGSGRRELRMALGWSVNRTC